MWSPGGDPHTGEGDGLVIFDAAGTPLWVSTEALRILAYPNSANGNSAELARTRCSCLFRPAPVETPAADRLVEHLISGRRRYFCRRTWLDTVSDGDGRSAFAVLLERSRSWEALTAAIANRFHLSPREHESLTLLGEGLTSKEMAERMRISPNTVKAFLRVIMIKLRVSNRSSIVGKVLGADGHESHAHARRRGSGPRPAHPTTVDI